MPSLQEALKIKLNTDLITCRRIKIDDGVRSSFYQMEYYNEDRHFMSIGAELGEDSDDLPQETIDHIISLSHFK